MSLTTEERERLARFSGVIIGNGFGLEYKVDGEVISNCHIDLWTPDDIAAPQWQLQACLEAVREKPVQFIDSFLWQVSVILDCELYIRPSEYSFNLISATPLQKCRAILLCLEESDELAG